jgi:lambda family phage portal protein
VTETRLDRLIAYFSPARGAQRLAARKAMAALAYEGARVGRREEGWVTGSSSANAEITGARERLRDRVRSLLRDNPYAVKAVSTLVANRIGTGIIAAPASDNTRVNDRVSKRWKRWIDRCDYNGRTDLYGLQSLAERARIESAAGLIRFVTLPEPEDAEDVPLRLQVLEPDFIDTTKNQRFSDSHEIREGIEYRSGRVVGYWLWDQHPGESSPVLGFKRESKRYPASDILHYYRQTRPGQLSGVSEFAPVIRRLYDLDGYADAELMRKKIAACSVGAVTTPTANNGPAATLGPTSTDAKGRTNESFAPGMYHYLNPGESVTFFDPKPSDGYHEFFSEELHAIAAGLGFPYELLTGDFSQVNYTSFRACLIQFKAAVESDQEQLIIPQIVQPVWDRFVMELALETETMPLRVPAKFTPPRFGLLDPAKETPAMIEAIHGKLRSWSDTVRRDGYEPDEVIAEIAKDEAAFAAANLPSPYAPVAPPTPEAPAPEPEEEEEEKSAA